MKRLCSLLLAGALLTVSAAAAYADSYSGSWNVFPEQLHDDVSAALTASGAPALPALPSPVEENAGFTCTMGYGAGQVTVKISGAQGKPSAIDASLDTSKATDAQAGQYGAACGAIMKVLTPQADFDAAAAALRLDSTSPSGTADNLLAYYSGEVLLTNEIKSGSVRFSAIRYPDTVTGIGLVVNNRLLELDVPPRIVDSRTLVPLRGIFEEIGAEVSWDQPTQTATIARGDSVVKVTIGSKAALVDGKEVALDVPAQLSAPSGNARTLVPVRFIAESLGAQVGWLNSPQAVIVSNR
ncbi:copper amine oxidase N-terminal domain-containing protein [Intestinibacillus massiliensis]|uniref:copper amine oxidase N-terminal domain-containing protein n=1 Tax=Intestinibacillus massiliensis TaxID=1871029 RepID=UPI001F1AA4F9|nr:copper amine oxidase N-terminal domain-containing protein [Intestinibacillus massiliensis]